jgi:hypothetical protein
MGVKKLTRGALIEFLAKDLLRREPDNNMEDARYRVTHTSPGSVDTLRDLALNARNHDLITEEQYLAAAPDAGYGGAVWHKHQKKIERQNARMPAAVLGVMMPPGTRRG